MKYSSDLQQLNKMDTGKSNTHEQASHTGHTPPFFRRRFRVYLFQPEICKIFCVDFELITSST